MNRKWLFQVAAASVGGLLLVLACTQGVRAESAVCFLLGSALLFVAVRSLRTSAAESRARDLAAQKEAARRAKVTATLENILRLGNVSYETQCLQEFVEKAWPMIQTDLDALRWAKLFAASLKGSMDETVAYVSDDLVAAAK